MIESLRQAGYVEEMISFLTDLAYYAYSEGNLALALKEFKQLIHLVQAEKNFSTCQPHCARPVRHHAGRLQAGNVLVQ